LALKRGCVLQDFRACIEVMSSAHKVLTLLFIASPISALSGRVQVHRHETVGAHKCSIHWEVPGRGVAKTSFAVSSCRLNCKPTFTDNYFTKKFPEALSVVQDGGACQCRQLDNTSVLRMRGDCSASDAQKRCFDDYMRLRTNEYKREFGKEKARIIPHFELMHERTFDYSVCEENACKDGNCVDSMFPSIMEGRSAEEIKVIADILKKYKAKGTLDEGEKELVDHLTKGDIDTILINTHDEIDELYDGVVKEATEPLTVKVLREIYQKKLQGTGVSVDHLLHVAGLTDDDGTVDKAAFRRFLEPDCDEE